MPTVGNCWVDNYPFSYVTSHYGRWNYYGSNGWGWQYDSAWSPAWVASVRCGDYYSWSPVGFDYLPVAAIGGAHFGIGGVDFFVGATSYCPIAYYDRPYYIAGCYPEFGAYAATAGVINIWNINIGGRDRIRVPYSRDFGIGGDFQHHRYRGLLNLDNGRGIGAADRVRNLEQRLGRTSFAGDHVTQRNERTVMAPDRRNGSVRQVSMRGENKDLADRSNPRMTHQLEPRVGRAADVKTGKPADEAIPTRDTVRPREGGPRATTPRSGGTRTEKAPDPDQRRRARRRPRPHRPRPHRRADRIAQRASGEAHDHARPHAR